MDQKEDKVTEKKVQITQQITQYVIANGMSDIGLRKLAQISGTSDRMLIYYFGTKDKLIGQVLHTIASSLADQLDAVLGQEKRPANRLRDEILSLSSAPQFYAIIQLWFEVVGLAARGEEPYAKNATAIAKNWLGWIEGRLEESERDQALELFAQIEGYFLLKIVGVD